MHTDQKEDEAANKSASELCRPILDNVKMLPTGEHVVIFESFSGENFSKLEVRINVERKAAP